LLSPDHHALNLIIILFPKVMNIVGDIKDYF